MTNKTLGLLILLFCLLLLPAVSWAQKQIDFKTWVAELRSEALSKGISQATVDSTLSSVQLLPRVIELEQSQPEFKLTIEEYLSRVVPDSRVFKGREELEANRVLLTKVYERYGVQPSILVALWGIETDFGRSTGGYSVIDALATLAYQGRRTDFFRRELFHVLRIVNQGHISPDKMIGSWAGAMGQLQLMPSSFLSFAVDEDGDGRIDIWNSLGDVFASAANYLSRCGWVKDESWGRDVELPKGFDSSSATLDVKKPLAEWKAVGVEFGGRVKSAGETSLLWSVVQPEGKKGRAFLVNNNYRALLKWNRSHHFAIAAGTLSDRIAAQ
jgi:membrane-bound lytic murein transglycosylase B